MAALVQDAEVLGLLEHHTRALSPESLEENLRKFAEGDLTDEDVFRAGGHGVFYLKGPPGLSQSSLIAVTGPQRDMHEAYPSESLLSSSIWRYDDDWAGGVDLGRTRKTLLQQQKRLRAGGTAAIPFYTELAR